MKLRYNKLCERECLFPRLLEACEEHGWFNLGLGAWIKSRRLHENGFQEISLRLLVWRGIVAQADRIKGSVLHEVEYRGNTYRFIFGKGGVKADAAYYQSVECIGECISRRDILLRLAPLSKPFIVIDLSQLLEHNLDEAGSLRRQLAATLGVIRKFLWDRHLVLTSAPEGTRGWLRSFIASDYVRITSLSTDDALDVYGCGKRRILLDPNADSILTRDDILEADAFILGGIVDKRPRPGATSRLGVEMAERRKIVLRGSIIGVPHTLNNLAEAILLARYVYDGDIERALYDVIPPHEARIRAYVEITRAARGKSVIDWDLYEELVKWLPIRPRDFEKAARMAGVRLARSYEEYAKRLESQQRPISSQAQR